MKTLVLGGTGWVGHQIAIAFADAGHDVSIVSRGNKTNYMDNLDRRIHKVTADKNDPSDMRSLLADRFDVIVDSVPSEQTIDLIFEYAAGLQHYLHCSSTGGYAPLPMIPGDETMPYTHFLGGWSVKQRVDEKAISLYQQEGFPATVIRPSYITGPGLLPLDNLGGRRPDFIPDIRSGKPIDLPNDGQALLHPVHCVDLADAFRLAAERPRSIGQIYNACLAKAVTLTRYIQITAETLNCEANIRYLSIESLLEKHRATINEIGLRFLATHMCYDISKIRTHLGYKPRMQTDQAIRETVTWAVSSNLIKP